MEDSEHQEYCKNHEGTIIIISDSEGTIGVQTENCKGTSFYGVGLGFRACGKDPALDFQKWDPYY